MQKCRPPKQTPQHAVEGIAANALAIVLWACVHVVELTACYRDTQCPCMVIAPEFLYQAPANRRSQLDSDMIELSAPNSDIISLNRASLQV